MAFRHTLLLCLVLSACSAAGPEAGEDPNVVLIDTVYFQLTGNDGAAFGQFGFGEVTREGDIFCALNSPGQPGVEAAPPHSFTGSAPGLYDGLRALVLQNGSPVNTALNDAQDRIELGSVDGQRIAILPGPDFDGHSSALGVALLGLVNADGRACLPFG